MNQITTPTPTKRIEYIDALRGFTMILVVFHHVLLFSFNVKDSLINDVIISFFMPLFFFISGLMGYKENMVWNWKTWWSMTKNKVRGLLIPTLILGLIYTYVYRNLDIVSFITHNYKHGYWFTITLLEMYVILYTVNVLLYNPNSRTFKKYLQLVLVILAVVLLMVVFVYRALFPTLETWCNALGFSQTFWYFPYFCFGYVCSMNKDCFLQILENRYFSFVIITLYVIGFTVSKFHILPYMSRCMTIKAIYYTFVIIVGFLGLLVVYKIFRAYRNSFTTDKKVGRALQYIGKRTLDIYLLHYFFLPYIPQLGRFLSDDRNAVLELSIGGGLSLLIIEISLVVSNILRTSPILAKYLLGVKK